ncbi:hypothetical protein KAFR_0F00240 [Kazachstania africana CBS 2517]|uniref:protein-tyrosine-phosphatase n=1 Tax=Kazachstania africana (strain ATCC 22294 / BCRC 22015 / CBS 2517 / CECT 1963 / NBRC 1671 / NRRL Y-8276) TaxID=1071382 RepID=H2AW71_KAZAF|nr:hypothetical protein KAFR_0F00240 [Kazachstania africana CBS 2517]CCF58621.1 hypothetical protein KAFR_0F00240 [Kazachstania africana CBS 2517]
MAVSKYPWYLNQTDDELLSKFKYIQRQEDEHLREATNGTLNSRWSLGDSILQRNDYRNRYVNIMPYERTRVKLNVPRGNDYINASYVKVNVPGQSTQPGYYIATQGPTRYTWDQFWQMCYQECPYDNIVIVMVTPLVEHGREKCYRYWPTSEDRVKISPVSQYPGGESDISTFQSELKIEYVQHERVDDLYTLTEIKLSPPSGSIGPTKTVHHFYFDQWRDMSRPEEILPIMTLSQHSHALNSNGNPVIVHCSAGVGRSGTFIALDHLIHDTADFKNALDTMAPAPLQDYKRDLIEQIVFQLRSQRMKMVQMKDQYIFIYNAAKYLYNLELHT